MYIGNISTVDCIYYTPDCILNYDYFLSTIYELFNFLILLLHYLKYIKNRA